MVMLWFFNCNVGMVKIGLFSDIYSFFDEKIFDYFVEVDEIWYVGDIGDF